VTAIQKADTDGNDKTPADPTWLPLLMTPPFPAYTSGHSTFSAAGATLLAGIFGIDNITFTLPSEVSGVAGRSFNSLSAEAAEAGRSRILGGVHFEFDNVAGQTSGRKLGSLSVNTLLPMQARTRNADGELLISRTATDDTITIDASAATISLYVNQKLSWSGPRSSISSLTIDAGNGDDRISVSTTLVLRSSISGGMVTTVSTEAQAAMKSMVVPEKTFSAAAMEMTRFSADWDLINLMVAMDAIG